PDGRQILWIDVEGALDQVLAGAQATLSRCDAVYVEVETAAAWPGQMIDVDVIHHLGQHGLLPVGRDIQRSWQYNLLFVHERHYRSNLVQKLRDRQLREAAGAPREASPSEVPGAARAAPDAADSTAARARRQARQRAAAAPVSQPRTAPHGPTPQ
ncbi:MAG TPA: hypothetical protein VFV27_00025, partial [Nevskiaceae bacterium]|nr:hypothetical protein [Nevskiaceae bacterium]